MNRKATKILQHYNRKKRKDMTFSRSIEGAAEDYNKKL